MSALETTDLVGVEILSVGGPVHGIGSPPEGDYWTASQLCGMAEAAAELADEVHAPAKIGHRGGDRPSAGSKTFGSTRTGHGCSPTSSGCRRAYRA